MKFDIVLMGATSFVGRITALRMAEFSAEHQKDLSWAIAGRSESKLAGIKKEIDALNLGVQVEMLIADSHDEKAITELCEQTRVVISTVGPYDQYGETLVKVCCDTGTHYCDLSGEPQFVHNMINKYEALAESSGACIVSCCGFDSLPSDLGVYHLQQESIKRFSEPCAKIDMRVKRMNGTFSGGTVASMVNIIKRAKSDSALRKMLMNPYALAPNLTKFKQRFINKVEQCSITDSWMAPFVMASINTKIVFRTAQLLPEMYPEEFYYNEGMLTGRGKKGRGRAKSVVRGLGIITVGSAFALSRWVLEKFVLPKPGQGPTLEQQETGSFIIDFYGETESGEKLMVEVEGDRDPGYGSTAKKLTQAALSLAFDLPSNQKGGFWTPAAIIAEPLLKRLPKYAGVTVKVIDTVDTAK